MVDLEAPHLFAATDGLAFSPPGRLLSMEPRGEREVAEALHPPGARLHVVKDLGAEHLVARTDPEQARTAEMSRPYSPFEPAAAQPDEIRDGRFGAWQHYEVGAAEGGGVGDIAHRDVAFER